MSIDLYQFSLGFALAGLIGYLAHKLKSLATSGAWAATLTGGIIFGLGGFPWAVVLITFFVSSSILSRLFDSHDTRLQAAFEKGGARDGGQVFANSGVAIVLVIMQAVYLEQAWPWIAYLGVMATVTADTWETEIGVLSKSAPRLINTVRMVDKGTSGGVSVLGTVATIGGGALIGSMIGFSSHQLNWAVGVILIAIAGLAGSLMDSLLGATVQAIYYCDKDEKETEQHPVHSCGEATQIIRGWPWFRNDHVNLVSSIFGGILAVVMWSLVMR